MRILIRLIVNMAAVALAAYLLAGVSVAGPVSLLLAAVLLGIVNTIVRPILNILAFPINLFTFGLFSIILNGFLVLFVARVVPGFTVANIWWAIAFSFVLSIVSFFLHLFVPGKE
jgi:putative membrane protein